MTAPQRLIILEEPGKHREVVPEGDTLEIGRAPTLGIVLSDRMVSRRHAVIRKRGHDLVLEDAGSTFGTYVNGRLIPRGSSVALSDGDVIEIGRVQVVCRLDPQDANLQGAARDAVFAAQANARLLVLWDGAVKRLPLACAVTLIGRASHCDVCLQGRAGPPEDALIRAFNGHFYLEPRSEAAFPRLNENQTAVVRPTPLESNSVFLLRQTQLLFLYDHDEKGNPLPDALETIPRRRLLARLSRETRITLRRLRALARKSNALGQSLGEILVLEKLVTPLFWRVVTTRILREPDEGSLRRFLEGWLSCCATY